MLCGGSSNMAGNLPSVTHCLGRHKWMAKAVLLLQCHRPGAGESVCHENKPEDWSLDLQHPHKSWEGMEVCLSSQPSGGRGRDSLGELVKYTRWVMKSGLVRDPASVNEVGRSWGRHPKSTSDLNMRLHACVPLCMQTHTHKGVVSYMDRSLNSIELNAVEDQKLLSQVLENMKAKHNR